MKSISLKEWKIQYRTWKKRMDSRKYEVHRIQQKSRFAQFFLFKYFEICFYYVHI